MSASGRKRTLAPRPERSHGEWIAPRSGSGRVRLLNPPTLRRRSMSLQDHQGQEQSAIRTDLGAIFVSMELSRSAWLITSLSPGAGEKMSRHSVVAGDGAGGGGGGGARGGRG